MNQPLIDVLVDRLNCRKEIGNVVDVSLTIKWPRLEQ